MADVLAAFDQLENEERAKKVTSERNAKNRKGSQSSGRSGGRPRTRTSHNSTHSLPAPVIGTGRLTPIPKHRPNAPSPPDPARSRESSVGGDRRISFAEPQRPQARRLYIPTKTASLASGFPYNPKLNKYGVLEAEWAEFSAEVVDAADVPTPTWAWVLHRKEVIRRIEKDIQYEGDFKRVLRKWNKHFKRKGFQAWLELPDRKGEPARSQSADQEGSSDEDKEEMKRNAKKYAKRFRMVVSSNVEKGSSVYSRTSSLTRSTTGEGVNLQQKAAQKAHEKATEHAAEQDLSEGEDVDKKDPVEVIDRDEGDVKVVGEEKDKAVVEEVKKDDKDEK